jgi:hypothetical protein
MRYLFLFGGWFGITGAGLPGPGPLVVFFVVRLGCVQHAGVAQLASRGAHLGALPGGSGLINEGHAGDNVLLPLGDDRHALGLEPLQE